jgi:hypothetical protein
MAFADPLSLAAISRALVVGAFGGIGLALTVTYSRRGPLIYPVFAALLAALALLLSRYATLPYSARFAAALAGFVTACVPFYAATLASAARSRRRAIARGRLPAGAHGPAAAAHLGPAGLLMCAGAIVSAGIAFIAG